MRAPTRLPRVQQAYAHEYFKGWWHGGFVFGLCGLGIGYLLARYI